MLTSRWPLSIPGSALMRASERGNEVDPPQESEHLHEPGENAGRHGEWDHPCEPERLPEQDDGRDQEQSGQRECPPQEDQGRSPGPEPIEDLGGRSPEDVRVVEPFPEQREGRVEPQWCKDQERPGGDLHWAGAGVPRSSGAPRNRAARRSQVSSPNTIAPLAPKIGNRSSMFLEIT